MNRCSFKRVTLVLSEVGPPGNRRPNLAYLKAYRYYPQSRRII